MDRKKLRQIIQSSLADCMKQNGFRRYKTQLCYYRIHKDVLSFILFNPKSYGYECGAYIQPLYIPGTALTLDLGETVERMEIAEREKYSLWTDDSEEKLRENMGNILRYCEAELILWLDRIGSPEGIREHIMTERRRVFCPPVWRYQAMAYSSLYLGDTANGKRYLEAFVREVRTQERLDEAERLYRAADACPGEVDIILRQNVQKTREILGFDKR